MDIVTGLCVVNLVFTIVILTGLMTCVYYILSKKKFLDRLLASFESYFMH